MPQDVRVPCMVRLKDGTFTILKPILGRPEMYQGLDGREYFQLGDGYLQITTNRVEDQHMPKPEADASKKEPPFYLTAGEWDDMEVTFSDDAVPLIGTKKAMGEF